MKHYFAKFLQFIFFMTFGTCLQASTWTNWTENSGPVFNPGSAYYPTVSYDMNKFGDNTAFYKMWYAGATAIELTYSNDGITWGSVIATTGLPANAAHPVVIYDDGGFGGGSYNYKMWYWNSSVITDITSIQYSESNNGIDWTAPQPAQQDPLNPLVKFPTVGYFYHLYGPGYVIYNPSATSLPGKPYTYPYVMFFDTVSSGLGTEEETGLAYSSDGITWSSYGSVPVLIPSGNTADWDGMYNYRSSVFVDMYGIYHMYYSGANGLPGPGLTYAHGIGHAYSADGLTWTKDADNPVFYTEDGVAWRDYRTYTPAVIFHPFCDLGNPPSSSSQMWFSGANTPSPSSTKAIGYAGMSCPPLVPLITNVNPNIGLVEGGLPIILTGKFFSNITEVNFGTVPATFVINSSTQITAVVPPGSLGIVDIRMSNSQGISDIVLADKYTYVNSDTPQASACFSGVLKTNRFLNKNNYLLETTWSSSPMSSNIIFYRVYKNGQVVAEIAATSPHVYNVFLPSKFSARGYELSAVNGSNVESTKTPLRILYE